MPQQDSVTVTHGAQTITTNTMAEADLRTEMEAPSATPSAPPSGDAAPEPSAPAGPVRDEKGRFVPKSEPAAAATPPADAGDPAEPAAPARRRDDTLPKHNPIARLNQALAQKAAADQRARDLEAELARYRQPSSPPGVTSPVTPPASGVTSPVTSPSQAAPVSGPPEPQFDQFAHEADPYTAYLQAWNRWNTQQEIAQALAAREAAHAAQTRAQAFEARVADGRKAHPDFDQVLTQADTLGLQVSAVMREAITDSPHAADLVYYLATHPEECTQLAEESLQTPVAAATVMRRLLESQLATRPVPSNGTGTGARPAVSTAKPPVTPVGSSPVVSDAPPGDEASAAEHARYWNRKLKVPGTR